MTFFLPALRPALRAFTALSAVVLATQTAHAAQEVRVLSGGADIRALPQDDGEVIRHCDPGEVLRVSTKSRESWHKVAYENKSGWVHESQFVPLARFSEMSKAGVQYTNQPERSRSRHTWVLHGHFSRSFTSPTEVQDALGATSGLASGLSYAGELGYRLTTRITVGLRGMVGTFAGTGEGDIEYSGSSTDVSLLLDYTVVHRLPIKFSAAIAPGYAISAAMTGSAGGNSVEATGFGGPTLTGKVALRWYLGSNFALALESGYRYFHPAEVALGEEKVNANLSMLFAGGGVTIEL